MNVFSCSSEVQNQDVDMLVFPWDSEEEPIPHLSPVAWRHQVTVVVAAQLRAFLSSQSLLCLPLCLFFSLQGHQLLV